MQYPVLWSTFLELCEGLNRKNASSIMSNQYVPAALGFDLVLFYHLPQPVQCVTCKRPVPQAQVLMHR